MKRVIVTQQNEDYYGTTSTYVGWYNSDTAVEIATTNTGDSWQDQNYIDYVVTIGGKLIARHHNARSDNTAHYIALTDMLDNLCDFYINHAISRLDELKHSDLREELTEIINKTEIK